MEIGHDTYRDYAHEEAEVSEKNFAVAARLGAAAQAFLFVSFLFAFFYLRALNSHHSWSPLQPSWAYGIAILVCVLGSVAAAIVAAWSVRTTGTAGVWKLSLGVAIVLALAAVVIQCVQYTTLSFGPGEGGYASVFVGWTGLFAVNTLVVAYWLTTMLTETLRGGGRADALMRPYADAVVLYWAVGGLVGLAAFILLYAVA